MDDAKFETKVNEENKKNWIQLVRQQTEGTYISNTLIKQLKVRNWVKYFLKVLKSGL